MHYWRVRTLDGANNFSPWSEVRKFTVGAPVWTNFAAAGLTPNGIVGGGTVQGVVHIQNKAPSGGQLYTLTSSNPSVGVGAGQRQGSSRRLASATFTVTTHSVSVSTPVYITVWSEGNGDHPILWVDPGAPGPPGAVTLSVARAGAVERHRRHVVTGHASPSAGPRRQEAPSSRCRAAAARRACQAR